MSNDVGYVLSAQVQVSASCLLSPEVSELIYPATPEFFTSILGKIYVSAEVRVAQVGDPMNG